MAKEQPRVELAPEITKPEIDQDADVFIVMSGMTEGFLCHAHGTATFPADKNPEGVYLLIVEDKPATAQLPTPAQVVSMINSGQSGSHGKKITITTAAGQIAWKCCSQLGAWCSATTKTKYNTLMAVTASNGYVPGSGYVSVLEGTNLSFYGLAKTSACPPEAIVSAANAAPSASSGEQEVYPTDRDGDWLLYSGVDAGALGMGPTLMLDGKPLSARVLAVSAKRVCWWHGAGRSQIVGRASGDLRIDDVTSGMPLYLFPDVSHSGIVLNQFTSTRFAVGALSSECREHPDLFSFDPDYPIRAQVNCRRGEERTGSYDLWVKVITR